MQLLMILKKGLLTKLEKNKKKILERQSIFSGRACFGWGGRSTANQHFFKVGLSSDNLFGKFVTVHIYVIFGQ